LARQERNDSATTASFNGLYKWELIYGRGPWAGLDDLGWPPWPTSSAFFNRSRLHGTSTDDASYTTPAAQGSRLLPSA